MDIFEEIREEERLLQETMKKPAQLKLKDMLREYQRTASAFHNADNRRWEVLSTEFRAVVEHEYGQRVQWEPFIRISDPQLPQDTIVPRNVQESYLKCNILLVLYMKNHKGRLPRDEPR